MAFGWCGCLLFAVRYVTVFFLLFVGGLCSTRIITAMLSTAKLWILCARYTYIYIYIYPVDVS